MIAIVIYMIERLVKKVHTINYILYISFCCCFSKKFIILRKLQIRNPEDTVQYIIDHRLSVSRFGDGEFGLMAGDDTNFQKFNKIISEKLKEILVSQMVNHIVCIPYPWKAFWILKYQAFEYWSSYLNNNLERRILPFLNTKKVYYDASFTRFYIDYKSDKNAKRMVPLIKQIWENRDVCIIEGEFTRLGIGNDLLANAKSVYRILAPSTNAFDKYDVLKETVKIYSTKSDLILIALGMTATCLAYDLAKEGYQAIDIGHVDVEYEWFRMKAKGRVPVNNKYVAESKERLIGDGNIDSLYFSQIRVRVL